MIGILSANELRPNSEVRAKTNMKSILRIAL